MQTFALTCTHLSVLRSLRATARADLFRTPRKHAPALLLTNATRTSSASSTSCSTADIFTLLFSDQRVFGDAHNGGNEHRGPGRCLARAKRNGGGEEWRNVFMSLLIGCRCGGKSPFHLPAPPPSFNSCFCVLLPTEWPSASNREVRLRNKNSSRQKNLHAVPQRYIYSSRQRNTYNILICIFNSFQSGVFHAAWRDFHVMIFNHSELLTVDSVTKQIYRNISVLNW